MKRVENPKILADLLERDPETHIYGLADLEEPFWSNSTWYLRENVAVGLISVGDKWQTGYAMSRTEPSETLALFAEVQDELGSGSWVTGATGLFDVVSDVRECRNIGPHWRMILDEPVYVEHDFEITNIGADNVAAMTSLHSLEPGGAFWLPGMLADYPFVGVWENGVLIASAGCHVASRRYGVVAIGAVFAHPDHRGRGLGAVATSELVGRIADRFDVIGLNVAASNEPAIRIYDRLGFRRAFQYEEIELL